jgi:hypothetical protein
LHGELQIRTGFHVGISSNLSPHFECVGRKSVFGCRLLVLAIAGLEEAFGPRVTMEPVERALEGIELISYGVRIVAYKCIDPGLVGALVEPGRIQMPNDGSSLP